jgi:hypothetical protein
MRGGVPIRYGPRGGGPAGEDVGFEQPLSERLCELLFAPRMRNSAGGAFVYYAGIISRDAFELIVSGLGVATRRGNGCGTGTGTGTAANFAAVVGIELDSGEAIPATVFSAGSAARRHAK